MGWPELHTLFGRTYLLTPAQAKWFTKPLEPDMGELKGKHAGETAYILAPGPSLNSTAAENFKNRLTLAINSAGFYVPSTYWVQAEAVYTKWFIRQHIWSLKKEEFQVLNQRDFCLNARSYHELLRFDTLFGRYRYVLRLEEIGLIPTRVEGTTLFHALGLAYWLGCPRAVFFGLDLGKQAGAYASGLPHSPKGARRPFTRQIGAIKKTQLPDIEIFNCNPYSNDMGLPFKPISVEEAFERGTG